VHERVLERRVSEGDMSAPLVSELEEKVLELERQLTEEKAARKKAEGELSAVNEAEMRKHRSAGLSRWSITDDDWHAGNPKAAKDMFGFDSWEETKHYIDALFQLVAPGYQTESTKKKQKGPGCDKMTEFEKCLLTKMLFNRAYVLLQLLLPHSHS
jgi:hypothetical protein